MQLPTSDKVSSYGTKPHIKKGYYPGRLLKVEVFSDKDGNPKAGKYGQQLIFEFAVYEKDPKTDEPIKPMRYKAREDDNYQSDVKISKFVYHLYKKQKKGESWVDGEYQTAITPNSAITELLKCLGWKFSTDDVDPEEFIGKWVELNVDEYESGEGDDACVASTIKDVSSYKGPEPKDVGEVKPTEKPKNVKKQVKHEELNESKEIKELRAKIENMKQLEKDGLVSPEGCKQAIEQIESQIEGLQK